jgi:hypothetical protein
MDASTQTADGGIALGARAQLECRCIPPCGESSSSSSAGGTDVPPPIRSHHRRSLCSVISSSLGTKAIVALVSVGALVAYGLLDRLLDVLIPGGHHNEAVDKLLRQFVNSSLLHHDDDNAKLHPE